jgi:hypothetical protein
MAVPTAPHPCQNLVISSLDFSQFSRFVVATYYFNLNSLMIYDARHLFHMLTCHLNIFFGEVSVLIICPFFFACFFGSGSDYVAQASLKLLDSNNPSASTSRVVGTTGVPYHA